MNRRHMILLGVAVTTLALTSSAEAYTMERINPVEPSLSIWLGTSPPTFRARFGGISWPANWDYAQWYVDETLVYTQTIGGQTATSTLGSLAFGVPGTRQVKVRAQWNTLGFNFWTDYLVWTVNVNAHPPVASRVSPDSPVTVSEGDTQAFTARGTDPRGTWDIVRVSWYLDGVHQGDFVFDDWIDPFPGEHTWSHTFDTSGTHTVEAVFRDSCDYSSAPGEAVWTVHVIGKRTLTVSSTAGGSVTSPGEGAFEYDEGTEVTLKATSEDGHHFTHWSGSVSSTSNPLQLTMDKDHNLTANFALDTATYTLTISSGPGGSVTSPGEGAFEYDEGTEVTLGATPDGGYHFTHWSGSVSSTSNPLHLTVNNDYSVTANFAADAVAYTLTISSGPGGSVTSPGEGALEYDEGTEVTLQATADGGYHFTHWSGSVSSTSNPLYLTVDNDYDVTANFALAATALYVDDDAPGDPGPGDPAVSDPQEDGTAEHPFDRIQEGIDAATQGGCVIVLAGTYVEGIDLRGLGIRLCSADGPQQTIIDGAGALHVVRCVSGEGPDTVIEGFTIVGGKAGGAAPDNKGGGMYNVNSSPTVNNCIFTGNVATRGGAGMGNVNSSPVVTNCLFHDNATAAGGMGAGMLNYGACRPVLTNCTFAGNAAASGNALVCDSAAHADPSTVMLTNCILWDGGDEIQSYDNSIVTVTYSDVQGGQPGEGNLSVDPVFVGPSMGNLHLGTGSPCIDAGTGTAGPPPAWQVAGGAVGGALEFDGLDDCVVSHTVASHLNGSSALTVALWVKSDVTNTDRGFIHFEDPHGTDDRGMRYAAKSVNGQGVNLIKIGVTCTTAGGRQIGQQQLASSSNVQTTAWQHLVMTWSSGQPVKLYINGVLNTPASNDPGLSGVLRGYTKLLIGRGGKYGDPSTNDTGWDGRIDDVAIFSRALGAAEVVRLRDQGGASFVGDAHLEGLWQFDESSGSVAPDSSGNERDGWLACLPVTDLDGKPRIVDGDQDGTAVADMGAYEWQGTSRKPGSR